MIITGIGKMPVIDRSLRTGSLEFRDRPNFPTLLPPRWQHGKSFPVRIKWGSHPCYCQREINLVCLRCCWVPHVDTQDRQRQGWRKTHLPPNNALSSLVYLLALVKNALRGFHFLLVCRKRLYGVDVHHSLFLDVHLTLSFSYTLYRKERC
jgi:hypothetical protein